MGLLKVSPGQLVDVQCFAGVVTAWIIDTGRAIRTGNIDDRAAALEQADNVIQHLDDLQFKENS